MMQEVGVKRYVTDGTKRFECESLRWRPTARVPEMQLVKVYPQVRYQRIIGFGAALTEVETETGGVIYRAYSPLFRLLPEQNAG